MGFDTAYEAISEVVDDHRWAFGTGFTDPFAGLDPAVPEMVDGPDLAAYCLALGDDALVMSHRLQQWLTRAPELEEETALANIGLDLLGQARLLLTRAGFADGSGRAEDAFAFGRTPSQFRNVQFVELPSADFAALVVQLLLFSTFRLAQLARLRTSADPMLAAVAARGANEVRYHRDYAAEWVIRLGDGTPESHERSVRALDTLTPAAGELFRTTELERRLATAGVAVDPPELRPEFDTVVSAILTRATLTVAQFPVPVDRTGRDGVHTPYLDDIVDELQSVAREHGGATW
ncbi:MAG TPA: 1,2-phenylacetyl-CoA epoxidase subunit PaaC [Jatrophihabitantaceae bacterium]|jgi:ring-1,2-phenylacetyl-CoA epoxidase subunit PaaC|nr:1,2-phenylacetyl-CoA epoxidase subunit PaaC [Jatrophihabitantaceae bacterium]